MLNESFACKLHVVQRLYLHVTESGDEVWFTTWQPNTVQGVIMRDTSSGKPELWDWLYTRRRHGFDLDSMSRLRPESGFERTVANEKSYLWLRRSPDHRNWG